MGLCGSAQVKSAVEAHAVAGPPVAAPPRSEEVKLEVSPAAGEVRPVAVCARGLSRSDSPTLWQRQPDSTAVIPSEAGSALVLKPDGVPPDRSPPPLSGGNAREADAKQASFVPQAFLRQGMDR